MIDIRLSRPEEIPAQKRLWKVAFGDDDAFIDLFYDCRGPEAQTKRSRTSFKRSISAGIVK